MEFQKIVNLFNDKNLPRFVTKKWIEVYDQSERNYNVNKKIISKTPMLRSDLCDFSDVYNVVKGDIIVKRKKVLHLKTMHHLSTAFQKLMVYKLTMQKTQTL